MQAGFETYGIQGLETLVQELGQPRFRAVQLLEWVYGKGESSYGRMTNLPAALRALLAEKAPLHDFPIVDRQVSRDGTRKYVFGLADGALVEAVGIPSRDQGADGRPRRLTVCFSTQVGCAMGCAFCATACEGFARNLLPGEIAQQVVAVGGDFGMRVSNAVAMGQGEPFLNYVNLMDALRIVNHPKGLGVGARHVTVSTCGITDGMRRMGGEQEQFTLALSLHAARQQVRDQLMPGMRNVSLANLHEALQVYITQSGRRASLEYLMLSGINDADADLDALDAFCQGMNVHVNILPYNPTDNTDFEPSPKARMEAWAAHLESQGIRASVRDSRGGDIAAACGQLKNMR